MSKKLLIVAILGFMLASLSADLYAGSQVRWAGNYAGTKAATYVPGGTPPICIQTNGGAPSPPVYSYCYGIRPAPGYGGAWAFAYANIITGNRVSISASGTWGANTFAGKAAGDTTRCSTYVEIIPGGDFVDLNLYGYFESPPEMNRLASCELSIVAEGEILFSGAINYGGDEPNTTVEGEFNAAPIIYEDGNARIEHVFPGIPLGGHDPESVEILLKTDAMRHSSIPSMTVYGAIILSLLILITGFYLIYRRRRAGNTA